MELIYKYFPELTEEQYRKFAALQGLYAEWNEKINVISRKDIENLYERHILHSLSIGKFVQFAPGTQLLDVGTGGGFPGIPLAILFPKASFHLVDSIGKKITVVKGVAEALGLDNLQASHERAEKIKTRFDFVLARAVTDISEFYTWVRHSVHQTQQNQVKNGIIYLKGGDLSEEFSKFKRPYHLYALSDYFSEEFYETKKLVHIPFS